MASVGGQFTELIFRAMGLLEYYYYSVSVSTSLSKCAVGLAICFQQGSAVF